jgi:hypothetical protein
MKGLLGRLLTLVVLVALAWWLFHWAQAEDVADAPRPSAGLLYPGLDTDRVTYLHMTLEHGHDIELQRASNGEWRITAPTDEVARDDLVKLQLSYLKEAMAQPVEQGGAPLRAADVGLDPPRHQITFGTGHERLTLLLGEIDPLGRWIYAMRVGDPTVLLATRNLVTLTSHHGGEWVDPHLLRGLRTRPTYLRVVKPEGVLIEARRVGDRWTLVAPEAVMADDDRVAQAIRSLQFAEQERVLIGRPTPEQWAELDLPSAAEIEAGKVRGATLFEIGNEGEGTVSALLPAGWEEYELAPAVRHDQQKVVGVPTSVFALFTNDFDWFRERRVLPPVRERARSVRIERGGEVLLDIQRGTTGRWSFAGPDRLQGEELENERIFGRSALTELLSAVDGAEVTAFGPLPVGEAEARLLVGWDEGGRPRLDRVDLYGLDGDGPVAARTTERPDEGLLLDREVLDLLDPGRADRLRSLSPLLVDADAWTALEIRHPELSDPLGLARDADGRWGGDDEWGRRYGLAYDMIRGFKGFEWRPSRSGVEHPMGVTFLDGEGGSMARLSMRLPEADEEPEAFGKPVVLVAVDGVPGWELAAPRELWWDTIEALDRRPERAPAPR